MYEDKKIKNKLIKWGICGFGAVSLLLPYGRAEAVDAWGVLAQGLGVYAAYEASLSAILQMGNNVHMQVQSYQQDLKENGLDPNENDIRLVDGIMKQLTYQGDYVLKTNSLPFVWRVTNAQNFNASCYPTDYISVNRALVRGLNCDVDELAAVLAHEMTHGIKQHSAHSYAQAVAQYYGMSFLNMDTGATDWNKLNGLALYSIAKNVRLPAEYEADEGGFYLMASAGFNPGGAPAAMARMDYYLKYETRDMFEYQPPKNGKEQEDFSDHPDTDKREIKLAEMMTAYGAGHVKVKDHKDVYIDEQLFCTVRRTADDYDNTMENAYYVAGALCKAFHDYDVIEAWQFQPDNNGRLLCLTAERINAPLRQVLEEQRNGELLQQLVQAAYASEKLTGAREKMRAEEEKRWAKIAAAREEVRQAQAKEIEKMRGNSDIYSDYGLGELALEQMARVQAAAHQDDEAANHAILGRAKAVNGDMAGALAEVNQAVAMNPKDAYNYLNRADVLYMNGEIDKALLDCEEAKKIDAKNLHAYLLSGLLLDEQAKKEEALANYQEAYKLAKDNVRYIPDEYLEKIAPKEYEKRQKLKAEKAEKEKKAKEKQEKEKKKTENKTDEKNV